MPNHLENELSPYLRQHRNNPVNWYPWHEEAFEKAKSEDKPIFLSIGYATCHWCHVMEHESFEDEEVAALMNKTFVSIKVDREERPDIDQVYMLYCQLSTRQGGWPLTIIMTPDGKPFFSATYLPKHSRFGRVGMLDLIPRVQQLWNNKRDEILESADQNVEILQNAGTWETSTEGPAPGILDFAFEQLAESYDHEFGGFGEAPKFPSPHQLQFLMQYAHRSGNTTAIDMASRTLRHMRIGGIFDHVGYGFHRYSTDRTWLLPHFEKMLYDQATIALAALDAFQITEDGAFKEIADKIFAYVLRDMTDQAGGFYSAEDADSEGVEGKFYVWSMDEIETVLGRVSAALFAQAYNFEKKGNFQEEATQKYTGENIPYLKQAAELVAERLGQAKDKDPKQILESLESARQALFDVRENRIHPEKDDKILTDWNGLMIAAMSRGARVLGSDRYLSAAKQAADFVLDHLTQKEASGRLWHRYRAGVAGLQANLDDYAFMIYGLICLYEASHEIKYLKQAILLCNHMLTHFWDDEAGGFFFTPSDGEMLIARQKDAYDDAIPSGNAMALQCLLRLGRITGDTRYEERASQLLRAFTHPLNRHPSGFCAMLMGLDFAMGPAYEIVLVGSKEDENTRRLVQEINQIYLPNSIFLFKSAENESALGELAPYTRDMQALNGQATVYVCENFQCNQPVTEVTAMRRLLGVASGD